MYRKIIRGGNIHNRLNLGYAIFHPLKKKKKKKKKKKEDS